VRRTTLFKSLIAAPEILTIPVAHDPLGARIIQQSGFKAVGCGGYASAAALLGAPDIQLMTLTEMVDAVWRMADAVDLPVWADGDNGHGNTTNVRRSVQQMEKAGAAALMLEDQVMPKRCGRMAGKHVVPIEEFVSKIKAAVDARRDGDFTILARTDAVAVNGFDDAVERAHRALEAGADWIFIEAPESAALLRQIPERVRAPNLANMIPGGKTPMPSALQLQDMGFAAVVWANAFTNAYASMARELADEIMRTGDAASFSNRMIASDQFDALVGLNEIRATDERDLAQAEALLGRSA
jgi:methylisocitrate lyase